MKYKLHKAFSVTSAREDTGAGVKYNLLIYELSTMIHELNSKI
jgi:hypothetical protein